jgi:hypothetical protein
VPFNGSSVTVGFSSGRFISSSLMPAGSQCISYQALALQLGQEFVHVFLGCLPIFDLILMRQVLYQILAGVRTGEQGNRRPICLSSLHCAAFAWQIAASTMAS